MIESSASGKLVLAGEWSVLEPGNLAIVSSVNRYLKVSLTPRADNAIILNLPDFKLSVNALLKNKSLVVQKNLSAEELEKISFIKSSIETVSQYVHFTSGFELTTDSSQTNYATNLQESKIGFGSSAGITVATISSILKYIIGEKKVENFPEIIFKLAIISHFKAQNKLGSGLDVASATYGGILSYLAFDPIWLNSRINDTKIAQLVEMPWPYCQIEKLELPKGLIILVGFTGKSASSTELLLGMNKFKEQHGQILQEIYQKIAINTTSLINDWQKNDLPQVLIKIKNNHLLLKELGEKSHLPLITNQLATLIKIAENFGFSAKISGAGGGDCGIAFGTSDNNAKIIRQEWIKAGIIPLDVDLGSNK